LIVGLELLKEDSIEEKMKSKLFLFYKIIVFFDLCNSDSSGKISENEIIRIFR
jgi:hypothetical protein